VPTPTGARRLASKQLVEPGVFIPEVDQTRVAQGVVAIRQKGMAPRHGVVAVHSAAGFALSHFRSGPRRGRGCQVGAAHGASWSNNKRERYKERLSFKRFGLFEVGNRVIDPIAVLLEQRGNTNQAVGSSGSFAIAKFIPAGLFILLFFEESLAQITAQQGALRFGGGGNLQILAPTRHIALAQPAQARPSQALPSALSRSSA